MTTILDLGAVNVNTVHMNKFTLTARSVVQSAVQSLMIYARRVHCLVKGEAYKPDPGPQWQQLELPFTRTPVRRWNR